tara:strand:- start:11 stop:661 length:651 start_codon:yes stop_codon:yes gene_type:complete
MNLTVKKQDGGKAGDHEVGFEVIGNAKGTQAVHEVVTAYRAAQRQGDAKVKTRAEVRGTGKKPWRQKGTGRARVGSRRNPVWRGGGVAHGPRPRDYSKKTNRKQRQLALRKSLSARLNDEDVLVVDNLALDNHKTKGALKLLDNLSVPVGATVLLVDAHDNANLRLAARNIKGVDTSTGEDLNTYQVLKYDQLIFARDAFAAVEKRLSAKAGKEDA